MNFALVIATFAIIVPAELPDKTMISSIILSSRYRPFPVWIGAAAGLILQAAIAVVAGRLLALAPHRVVEIVVAALFLGGAGYLLWTSSTKEAEEGEDLAEKEIRGLSGVPSGVRIAATTFAIVTLAEFGDLTQVIIANLAAKYRDPWSVFLGASLGFVAVSAAGVAAGRAITRVVPLQLVRRLSGVVLLGLGIWTAVSAATNG